jgi:TRAP-type C4-dicarboxylate transport system substrate-binding protein
MQMPSALRPLGLWILCATVVACGTEPQSVTVGGRAGPNTPGDLYWNRFADHVAETTAGTVDLKLFIRGEIGPEETLFAHLRRGRRVQLAGISTTTVSQILPELDVLRLPFLFDSMAEAGYVLDEHLKQPLTDRLLEHDLVMIDFQSAGFFNVYAKTPILTPADIVGQRIRINASPAAVLFMKAVNADIVAISFSEIVTALQTGLIDGGEQSTQLFMTGGMAKFAPHYSLTRHGFLTALILANRPWFERLPPDQQQIFRDAVPSDVWYREYFTSLNVELLRAAAAEGLVVHELSPEQRTAWRERTADTAGELIDELGPAAQRF